MVPGISIAAMVACIVMAIAFPVAVFIYFARRVDMNLSAVVLGLIMYVIFDAFIINLFDTTLMQQFAAEIYDAIYQSKIGYTIYYAFIHSFFYVIGFYVVTRMSMKDDVGIGNGIAIGIGCAGTNMIFGISWPMVNNIIASVQINKNGIEQFLSDNATEDLFSMEQALSTLTDTPAYEFLIAGLDAIILAAALVAVAAIIHLATTHRAPMFYLGVGMILFMVYNLFPAMYTVGIITNVLVFELFSLLAAAVTVVVAIWLAGKYKDSPLRY